MSENEAQLEQKKIRVAVEKVVALRDAIVAGVIQELHIHEAPSLPTDALETKAAPSPTGVLRPDLVQAAIAVLRRPDTCIYLGGRYGLTPHSKASPLLLADLDLGIKPPTDVSLREAMSWLASQIGLTAAKRHLSEVFASLDQPVLGAVQELHELAQLAAGHVIATGAWSARIQIAFGCSVNVAQDGAQAGALVRHSKMTRLLMLHGSAQNFQNALVVEEDVDIYNESCRSMSSVVEELLRSPWIILGTAKATDQTFLLMARSVSKKLEQQQRPLFVIDPRPEEEVQREWPAAALRHLRMEPTAFLALAKASQ